MESESIRYVVTIYQRDPVSPVMRVWQLKRCYEKLNEGAARSYAKDIKICLFRKALIMLEATGYVVLKETATEKIELRRYQNHTATS